MQSQIENEKSVVGLNTGCGDGIQDLQDNRSVKARSASGYWAIRDFDGSATPLAEKLGFTQSAMSISFIQGERILKDMRFDLNLINEWKPPSLLSPPFVLCSRTLLPLLVGLEAGNVGRCLEKYL